MCTNDPSIFLILGSLVSDFIGNASPSKQEVTRQTKFSGPDLQSRGLSMGGKSVQ